MSHLCLGFEFWAMESNKLGDTLDDIFQFHLIRSTLILKLGIRRSTFFFYKKWLFLISKYILGIYYVCSKSFIKYRAPNINYGAGYSKKKEEKETWMNKQKNRIKSTKTKQLEKANKYCFFGIYFQFTFNFKSIQLPSILPSGWPNPNYLCLPITRVKKLFWNKKTIIIFLIYITL